MIVNGPTLPLGLLQGELDRVDHVARPGAVGPLQRQARVDRQRVRAARRRRVACRRRRSRSAAAPSTSTPRTQAMAARSLRARRLSVRLRTARQIRVEDPGPGAERDDHGRDEERVQGLPADRPEDDPGAETDGGGDDETHCGARLTDEPGGELRYELARRRGRVVGLRRGTHEARADDHAVRAGVGPPRRRAAGVAMPKPSATGTSVCSFTRPTSSPKIALPAFLPLACGPGHRDRVDEALRLGADEREALAGRRRRHERHERDAVRVRRPR